MTKRFKLSVRLISWVTVIIFSFSSLAQAAPFSFPGPVTPAIVTPIPVPPFLSLPPIELAPELGRVEQVFPSVRTVAKTPFVYLIQDAHDNLDAQENIRRILKNLIEKEKVSLVCFEGGSLELDRSFYDFTREAKSDAKVWDALFAKGQIGGLERAALESKSGVRFFGIEDEKVYFDNIHKIQRIFSDEDKSRDVLTQIEHVFSERSGRLLTGEAKKLRDLKRSFENKQLDLSQYAKRLIRGQKLSQHEWPQLARVLKLQELEARLSKNDSAVQTELEAVKKKSAKSSVNFIWDPTQHARVKGRLRWYFERWFDSLSTTYSQLPTALTDWISFYVLQDELSARELFDEIKRFEKSVWDAMPLCRDTREFLGQEQDWQLAKKMIRLELTREEWEQVRDTDFSRWHDKRLQVLLKTAKENYALVEQRDEILSRRFLERLAAEKIGKVAVLTGGFHTDQFAAALKEKKIGFAVISPAIHDLNRKLDYRARMTLKPQAPSNAAYHQTALAVAGSLGSEDAQPFKKILKLEAEDVLKTPATQAASLGLNVRPIVLRELVVHSLPEHVEVIPVMHQAAFDTSGKGRLFFDRVGNFLVLDGGQVPFSDPGPKKLRKPMDKLIKDYEAANPDKEVLAALPNGNLGYNDWFVGVSEGKDRKVYRHARERYDEKPYDMLVTKIDGTVSIMTLKFKDSKGQAGIFDVFDAEEKDQSQEIKSAIYGQRIIKNGKFNLDAVADQFDDLRHLLRLPVFEFGLEKFSGGQLCLGFSDGSGELYKDKKKLGRAVRGEVVTLSLDPLKRLDVSDELRDQVFSEWGYKNMTGQKTPSTLQVGEYLIDKTVNTISIRFSAGVHPHSIFGVTEKGNLVVAAVPGETHFEGAQLKDVANVLISQKVQDAFLWANGKDVIMKVGDQKVVTAQDARGDAIEVLLFVRKSSKAQSQGPAAAQTGATAAGSSLGEESKEKNPSSLGREKSFADEKEIRRTQIGKDTVRLGWGRAAELAEPGVRRPVRLLNQIPFIYTNNWSHSGLWKDHYDADHDAFVAGDLKNLMSHLKSQGAYTGSDEAGFIHFRVDVADERWPYLRADLKAIDQVRIEQARASNAAEADQILILDIPAGILKKGAPDPAYDAYLEQKWSEIEHVLAKWVKARGSSLGHDKNYFDVVIEGVKVNLIDAMIAGTFKLVWIRYFKLAPLPIVSLPEAPPYISRVKAIKIAQKSPGRTVTEKTIRNLVRAGEIRTDSLGRISTSDFNWFLNTLGLVETSKLLAAGSETFKAAALQIGAKHVGRLWFIPVDWIEKVRQEQHLLVPVSLLAREMNISFGIMKRYIRKPKKHFGFKFAADQFGEKKTLLERSLFKTVKTGKENFLTVHLMTAWQLVQFFKKSQQMSRWDSIASLAKKVGVTTNTIDAAIRRDEIQAKKINVVTQRQAHYRISPAESLRVQKKYKDMLEVYKKELEPYTNKKINNWKDLDDAIKDWDRTETFRDRFGFRSNQAVVMLIQRGISVKGIHIATPFASEGHWYIPPAEVKRFMTLSSKRFQEVVAFVKKHVPADTPLSTVGELKSAIRDWFNIKKLMARSGMQRKTVLKNIERGKLVGVNIELLGVDQSFRGWHIPPKEAEKWLKVRRTYFSAAPTECVPTAASSLGREADQTQQIKELQMDLTLRNYSGSNPKIIEKAFRNALFVISRIEEGRVPLIAAASTALKNQLRQMLVKGKAVVVIDGKQSEEYPYLGEFGDLRGDFILSSRGLQSNRHRKFTLSDWLTHFLDALVTISAVSDELKGYVELCLIDQSELINFPNWKSVKGLSLGRDDDGDDETDDTGEFDPRLREMEGYLRVYLNDQNWQRALEQLDQMENHLRVHGISMDPEYYLTRGQVYMNMGSWKPAFKALTDCINGYASVPNSDEKVKRELQDAYFERGWAFAEMRDFASAITDFHQALKFTEKEDSVSQNRILEAKGIAHLNHFEWTNAQDKLLHVTRRDNEERTLRAWLGLAYAYRQADRTNDEKRILKKAQSEFPDSPKFYFYKALMLYQQSYLKYALQNVNNAIERLAKDEGAPVFLLKGYVLLDMNQLQEAEAAFRRVVVLDPLNGEARLQLAGILFSRNDWERANAELEEAALLLQSRFNEATASHVFGNKLRRKSQALKYGLPYLWTEELVPDAADDERVDHSKELDGKASENPGEEKSDGQSLGKGWASGDIIGGHFRIVKTLAVGGFGVLLLADELSSDHGKVERRVVLKQLARDRRDRSGVLPEEAKFMSDLGTHENIPKIYDYHGDDANDKFIVMEHIEGESLADVLEENPGGATRTRVQQLIPVAQVLEFVHEKGVTHQDVKPSNIMIREEDGKPFLIDFGIASQVGSGSNLAHSNTLTTALAGGGTLAYMAPEQIRGEAVSPAMDVWAFGVMLYEIAAGELPFQPKRGKKLEQVIQEDDPKILPDSVPAELRNLIFKMLAKNPNERVRSMAEVARTLAKILPELPEGEKPVIAEPKLEPQVSVWQAIRNWVAGVWATTRAAPTKTNEDAGVGATLVVARSEEQIETPAEEARRIIADITKKLATDAIAHSHSAQYQPRRERFHVAAEALEKGYASLEIIQHIAEDTDYLFGANVKKIDAGLLRDRAKVYAYGEHPDYPKAFDDLSKALKMAEDDSSQDESEILNEYGDIFSMAALSLSEGDVRNSFIQQAFEAYKKADDWESFFGLAVISNIRVDKSWSVKSFLRSHNVNPMYVEDFLFEKLHHREKHFREAAAILISDFTKEKFLNVVKIVQRLAALLSSQNEGSRDPVVMALGLIGEAAYPACLHLVDHEANVPAAQAISRMGAVAIFPLIQNLKNPDAKERELKLNILGEAVIHSGAKEGLKSAVQTLIDNAKTSQSAIRQLGAIGAYLKQNSGDPEVLNQTVDALTRLMDSDAAFTIRLNAVESLIPIEGQKLNRKLVELQFAAEGLPNYFKSDPDIIEALIRSVMFPNFMRRDLAERVLVKIIRVSDAATIQHAEKVFGPGKCRTFEEVRIKDLISARKKELGIETKAPVESEEEPVRTPSDVEVVAKVLLAKATDLVGAQDAAPTVAGIAEEITNESARLKKTGKEAHKEIATPTESSLLRPVSDLPRNDEDVERLQEKAPPVVETPRLVRPPIPINGDGRREENPGNEKQVCAESLGAVNFQVQYGNSPDSIRKLIRITGFVGELLAVYFPGVYSELVSEIEAVAEEKSFDHSVTAVVTRDYFARNGLILINSLLPQDEIFVLSKSETDQAMLKPLRDLALNRGVRVTAVKKSLLNAGLGERRNIFSLEFLTRDGMTVPPLRKDMLRFKWDDSAVFGDLGKQEGLAKLRQFFLATDSAGRKNLLRREGITDAGGFWFLDKNFFALIEKLAEAVRADKTLQVAA
ncbi:MAG: protein kinase [Candidatus Omnitrophica bacterium]|nr:protein kinase [Candidatus Omnitrophota bacterium]